MSYPLLALEELKKHGIIPLAKFLSISSSACASPVKDKNVSRALRLPVGSLTLNTQPSYGEGSRPLRWMFFLQNIRMFLRIFCS